MKRFAAIAVRFSVAWGVEALSLLAVALIVPGISFDSSWGSTASVAMASALILAIVNVLIRPLLILITLPVNMLTLGFFTFVTNAAMLIIASRLLPFFQIDGWGSAMLGALVLMVVNTILTSLTHIDEDYSFFDGVVQWIGKRRRETVSTEPGRGLVMLEIDGLSYTRMRRAAEQGIMPTVHRMLQDGTHKLASYDCGLPSQTSSAQAGIMYGENFDIPAFRWYEKGRRKLMVSNNFRDAYEMNARYAHGQGLLRGGSSINNHMAGDARRAFLTMSVLTDKPEAMEHRSFRDLNLFFVNPYMFPRSLLLTLWDVVVEIGQAVRQSILNVRPRVSRFHKAYPLVRAGANVFLRDLSTFMVTMDVIRGVPAIYTTYVGYDEVAHHAGPDTRDAMNTLKGLDKQLRRVVGVVERKAPRPYDVVLLSDHGQSAGATFKQRYGNTLKELIEDFLREKATVAGVNATENSYGHAMALMAEIQGLEGSGEMGRIRGAVIKPVRKAFQKRLERTEHPEAPDAEVVVCESGNLANVYFESSSRKLTVDELNTAYPGLVDAAVAHPGVGFVVGYAEDGTPLAFGKEGCRNLITGSVSGADPLIPYGDPDHRSTQILYLARFPHAGDLIVNSAIYDDGHVAAFEELVGSHGGLGGQQTEAFVLHPADMVMPATSNATDIFHLLDARRGLPGEPLRPRTTPSVNPWAPRDMASGIRNVRRWVPLAVRALRLDRAAYREVAADPFATGPALAVVLIAAITAEIGNVWGSKVSTDSEAIPGVGFAWTVGLWLGISLAAYAAGKVLRAEGDFSGTVRAVAFAQAYLIIGGILQLIPTVGHFLFYAATVMMLVATWIASREALKLGRLAAVLIPIVGALIFFIALALVTSMAGGIELTLDVLLSR